MALVIRSMANHGAIDRIASGVVISGTQQPTPLIGHPSGPYYLARPAFPHFGNLRRGANVEWRDIGGATLDHARGLRGAQGVDVYFCVEDSRRLHHRRIELLAANAFGVLCERGLRQFGKACQQY